MELSSTVVFNIIIKIFVTKCEVIRVYLLAFASAIYRASDKCQREKRKTVNGDDLLWAMATLGFEDYIEPLKSYLNRYREVSNY